MKPLFQDTSPEAEQVLLDLLRKAPVWKRMRMVADLNETLRLLALADIRRSHPTAKEGAVRRLLAARLLSKEEFRATYGSGPTEDSHQI